MNIKYMSVTVAIARNPTAVLGLQRTDRWLMTHVHKMQPRWQWFFRHPQYFVCFVMFGFASLSIGTYIPPRSWRPWVNFKWSSKWALLLNAICMACCRGLSSDFCSLSCTLPTSASESSRSFLAPVRWRLSSLSFIDSQRRANIGRSIRPPTVLKTWMPGWAPANYAWILPRLKSYGWVRDI